MTNEHTHARILDLLEAERLGEAGTLLLALQEAAAEEVATWTLTATYFIVQGRYADAAEALRLGHACAPESAEVAALLAHVQEAMGASASVPSAPPAVTVPPAASPRGAPPARPRLALFVQQGLDQFLDDLVAGLQPHYEVRKVVVSNLQQVEEPMRWADVCWFEWCNEVAVHASRLPLAAEKKVVCRLHRYEAFTDMPSRVAWEHVDGLMLVAPHLQTVLESTVPGIASRTRIQAISNGVDVDRLPFQPRRPGHRIAYVGYLHLRKNPTLLLQVMAALVRQDPRYELHIAGQFQDSLLQLYWEHQRRALGLERHIHFHGWQEDVAAWVADKHYLLSTSIHESFGYGIADAMAMGIKPVVHNFVWAGEIWPEEILFNTVEEAVGMITAAAYESETYRGFIERRYSLGRQVAQTHAFLEEIRRPSAAPAQTPLFAPGALVGMVDRVRAGG